MANNVRKSVLKNSIIGVSSGLITTIEFEEDFLDALSDGGIVLVEFMAYNCKPCQWMDPFLENEKIYTPMGVKILKVDVKEFKALAKKEKIKAIPTFVFYEKGERVDSFAGASPQKVVEILDQMLGIEKPKPEEEPESDVPKGLP